MPPQLLPLNPAWVDTFNNYNNMIDTANDIISTQDYLDPDNFRRPVEANPVEKY